MPQHPVPTEIHIARGNPSHRRLPDVISIAPLGISKPADMEPLVEEAWDELVPMLEGANLLQQVDSIVLEGLCILLARARQASQIIKKEGFTVKHPKTGTLSVHPAVRIERDAWAEVVKVADRYGMTPVARTKLGLAVLKGRSLQAELSEKLDLE